MIFSQRSADNWLLLAVYFCWIALEFRFILSTYLRYVNEILQCSHMQLSLHGPCGRMQITRGFKEQDSMKTLLYITSLIDIAMYTAIKCVLKPDLPSLLSVQMINRSY